MSENKKIKFVKTKWEIESPEYHFFVKCPKCKATIDDMDLSLESYADCKIERTINCGFCDYKFKIIVDEAN